MTEQKCVVEKFHFNQAEFPKIPQLVHNWSDLVRQADGWASDHFKIKINDLYDDNQYRQVWWTKY